MPFLATIPGAIIGTGILGGAASIYGANKAAQAAKDAQRNLPAEISGILGQVPAAQAAGLANQQQYGDAYTALGNANIGNGLFGPQSMGLYAKTPGVAQHIAENRASGYYDDSWTDEAIAQNYWDNVGRKNGEQLPRAGGGLADTLGQLQGTQDLLNARSATAQRAGNLADMEALAPRADALRRSLNPEYYASLNRVDSSIDTLDTETKAGNPYTNRLLSALGDTTGGYGRLEKMLGDDAAAALGSGGAITEQEAQQARNEARAAAEARGLSYSPGAQADEILNLDKYRRQRQESNRAYATGITGLLRSGSEADRGFALTAARDRTSGLATVAGLRGNAAGLRSASLYDPASVLGSVDNRLNSTATLGMAQQQFQGAPDYLSQLLGYGSDVYGSNANAKAAGGIGQANAYAALGGGLLSAGGSLGGAMIIKGAKT